MNRRTFIKSIGVTVAVLSVPIIAKSTQSTESFPLITSFRDRQRMLMKVEFGKIL